MSVLAKLTLIIPTYNRPAFALRNMKFWSGRETAIHVMDGSSEPIQPELLIGLDVNIRYHYLPVSIHERFAHAMKLVETEYVAFHGDDEFFSPKALEKCIMELDANNELVSCMGRCLGFDYINKEVTGRPMNNELRDYAIMQDDPIERMVAHMSNYTCSTIYAVSRTQVWKKAMSIFIEHPFTVFSMDEYQFEIANAFMGKSKVIPDLYWFRSLENDRIPQEDRSINRFNIWWEKKENKEEKDKFIDLMTDSLLMNGMIDKATLRKGIIRTGDAFTKWGNSLGIRSIAADPGFIYRWFSFFFNKLRAFLKSMSTVDALEISAIDKKKMYPFAEAINQLREGGVMVNELEIKEIEKIVMNFYNTKREVEELAHA